MNVFIALKGNHFFLFHFSSTFRYLDDLFILNFEQMVDRIYLAELHLNKDHYSDAEAPFVDLNLSTSNGTVSTKFYDKRGDLDFDIVNFPFLDGDVPRRASYGVYLFVSLEHLLT